jgi:O-antigen ligase
VAERLDPGSLILAAGLAGLAAVFGTVAGIDPKIAFAGSLALAFCMIAVADLTWGLVGFIALSFLALLPNLGGPLLSLAKIAGAVLAISWLAGIASGRYTRLFPSDHPNLTFALISFLAWNALSVVWAEDPDRVYAYAFSFLLSFLLFAIIYSAVVSTRVARMLVFGFIVGATVTSAYGILVQPDASALATSPAASDGLDRLAGTVGDPNELASLLVAGVALSGAIVFNRAVSPGVRMLTGAAAGLMLLGVLMTLSRGGLVALAALILTGMLVAGRYRPQMIAAGLAIIAVALTFFFGIASPEARDRITAADGGGGRTDIWKVGERMVAAEPVTGVGAANFQVSAIHYLLTPGAIRADDRLIDSPSVVHNSYLQILVETGVIGLGLFLAIVASCIAAAIRARRAFAARDDRDGELLAIAVICAIASILAADLFLSEENSKHLWFLLALGPALLGVSKLSRGTEPEAV